MTTIEQHVADQVSRERVRACISACAGISNPVEAVEKARAVLSEITNGKGLNTDCGCDDCLAVAHQAREALAALGETEK